MTDEDYETEMELRAIMTKAAIEERDEARAIARRLMRFRPDGEPCWCWGDEPDGPHQPQCAAIRALSWAKDDSA